MRSDAAPPSVIADGDVAFDFSELFFSRTDPAGIIQYGNSVFQRVAAYPWDELLGKPHKLVRHADMPRAVFWLLWATIKQGSPIGAYVKNRTKDGCHYWVFAIVTPVDDGYLSVRLRPSSDLFAIVKREYAALLEIERREQLTPAASAERLLARLGELGFPDYQSFMAAALGRELAARDIKLGRPADRSIAMFADLLVTADALLKQAEIIADAYAVAESVPFNFRVLAAQLGQEGAAIAIISSNYTMLSAEIKTILAGFIASARDVAKAINEGCFLVSTARVQRELLAFFGSEAETGPLPREAEMASLDRQQRDYGLKAAQGLQEIARTIRGFQQSCVEMTRLAAGLEVTRIMGKVECARHTAVRDRTDELLGDLEAFQRTVAGALKAIERMNAHVSSEANGLIAMAQAA